MLYILKGVYCEIVIDETSEVLMKKFNGEFKINISDFNYRVSKFTMPDKETITLRQMSK